MMDGCVSMTFDISSHYERDVCTHIALPLHVARIPPLSTDLSISIHHPLHHTITLVNCNSDDAFLAPLALLGSILLFGMGDNSCCRFCKSFDMSENGN